MEAKGWRMGQARDIDEFAEFAAASLRDLRRTAYLMCGDWHLAEDVAQEALIRAYRSWRRVQRRESLPGYARQTVVRLVIDERRRPKRRELVGAEPPG
jgi:RNA polymerase sigma factor (sigma-70 family)